MPVEPLPTGTPGPDEIARWSRAAPGWDDLPGGPDAPRRGRAVAQALADVDPALRSLVERLGTLYRTQRVGAGGHGRPTTQYRGRGPAADEGVEAYEVWSRRPPG